VKAYKDKVFATPHLLKRPRRLRSSPAIRDLVTETVLTPSDFIIPLFVHEASQEVEKVESMPGVVRHTLSSLIDECRELFRIGIRAVALFPCIATEKKDVGGSYALDGGNILNRAVMALKQSVPELLIITDVALDPYTSHGHDGLLRSDGKDVDNDRTVEMLCRMAVLQSRAGADIIAPSDMMDGRIGAIRTALDIAGFAETSILAYSAKFASAYYGPFRDAVGSKSAAGGSYLDKRGYQLNPANAMEAVREAVLDEEEGADILMVKPAGPYLDVIRAIRRKTLLPLAAYQVSGEYAQIHAAARLGWLDLEKARDESLLAIKRAGANFILTYFAKEMVEKLSRQS